MYHNISQNENLSFDLTISVQKFESQLNYLVDNNYRSYFLNNLYENNCINKDYSPIHFIERLFGVIKL